MEDLVTITVNGQQLRVAKGTLLWEACKLHGIDIPIFCYHTKLGPVGACRTCLVEQEGVTKGPITACSTPVADGMVIRTRSAVVEKAQRGIFEFLLANHPLDCPICDRGGECPLQDQTFAYGPGSSRYVEPKRHHVKPIVLGPTIALDRERCVLCWRCVRFCAEVAEDKSIVLLDRGDHTVVGTYQDEPYVSNFSGNVVELCPVGALTSRKQRFNFRPWELQNRPSVCPHCPMGCNINVSVRKNDEVIRFLSRDNPHVDNSWLCDRGRYNFEFINSPERLKSPLVKRGQVFEQVSWEEALGEIAERIRPVLEENGPDAVAGIGSARLTNENLFTFKRFMTDVIGSDAVDHFPRPSLVLDAAGESAYATLAERTASIDDLSQAKTIVLLGANPSRRAPVLELRIRGAVNKHGSKLLAVQSEDMPLTSKAAAVVSFTPETFASTVRSLAADLPGKAESDALTLLRDRPVVVLYDDSFPGVGAGGDALAAVAELVAALAPGTGVIPLLDECNSMGARDLRMMPAARSAWPAPLAPALLDPANEVKVLFLLGADLVAAYGEDMATRLDGLDLLVVHELMPTETARHADIILPAASFAEQLGTLTNLERRVQMISPTVPSPGIARPDWEILVDLSQHFDRPLDYTRPEAIWADIARETPVYAGMSYADVGPRGTRAGALQPV